MDKLGQITTLLKENGINATSKQLKLKKADIYKFLENNGLTYEDGEVKPISDIKNEMAITKVIQKDNTSNNKPLENVIQKYNNDIDIETLKELISLIEPIKEVIQAYNKSINIIEVEKVELNAPSITEVKQKLFKVDIDMLERWNKFVLEHKEYKVQSLITLALKEFLDKYE